MAQVTAPPLRQHGFGQTSRRDDWWLGPVLTFLGLTAFVVYGTWAAWQGDCYEIRQVRGSAAFHGEGNKPVAPYLSPFFAPLIYDPNGQSPHALIHTDIRPSWLPLWFPFSAGFLILAFPGLFRFTCYYYRKAYYRAFWMDPPACAVGEPRKGYLGENHLPLLLQNSHRYWMYIACIFLLLLWWDALYALFWWPVVEHGVPTGSHHPGIGLGTVIMLVNVVLLTGFTLGCNSVRHLVGGRLNHFACFTCPVAGAPPVEKKRAGFYAWRLSSLFNEHHMEWAWLSLFVVGFTDLYIRLCSLGIWDDPHIVF
jgi:hypothetical protein